MCYLKGDVFSLFHYYNFLLSFSTNLKTFQNKKIKKNKIKNKKNFHQQLSKDLKNNQFFITLPQIFFNFSKISKNTFHNFNS